jgi:hypothetical protein
MPSIYDLIVAIRDAGEHEPDAMITLTLHADDEKWAQLLPEKINLCYPFAQAPNDLFTELEIPNADKAIVGFWEARLFADFETSSMTVDQLSGFLNAYLIKAFGTANMEEYNVSFDVAERGRIEADSKQEFLRKIVALKRQFEGKSTRN